MTHRSATPDAVHGVVLTEVALAAAGDGGATPAPDWIKVTPRGRHVTRDGRFYVFEPERLVARFDADGIEVPVDLDHELAVNGLMGRRARAVGWIDRLEARPDGTYAHVSEWLPEGIEALSSRTHRFVSPTFRHGEDMVATWLHSAALVAAPALAMPAIAAADLRNPETPMKTVLAALGLADGADEAACLAAVQKLQAHDGFVALAVHQQALTNLATVSTELETLKAAGAKAEVAAVLEEALAKKKILPSQREQYETLAALPGGLAQVKALLAALPEQLVASGLDQAPPAPAGQLTGEQKAICSAMGLSEELYLKTLRADAA